MQNKKENNQFNILLIDDDVSLCTVVSHQLQSMGYNVIVANSGQEGIEKFKQSDVDLILLDLQMPDMSGLKVLDQIRLLDQTVSIIIITAYGTIESAVHACQKGADDYLTKPFAKEQLLFTIEKTRRFKELEKNNIRLQAELEEKYQFGNIITRDKKLQTLLETAGRAAMSDATVLITGESGTGKELLARAIHLNSPRREKAFIAVNCPSIPDTLIESELFGHERGAFTGALRTKPGKFELANHGTLFLDEIGDLKSDLQAKLLRTLQEHEIERVGGTKTIPIDVRIIAATNQDLTNLVAAGAFRQDLFYRLNVIPLTIPPLRERKGDIPILIDHFIKKYSDRDLRVHPEFLQKLLDYDWPGNVRELENVIQRAVILCPGDELTGEFFDSSLVIAGDTSAPSGPSSLEDIERQAILKALEAAGWNQSRAANILNIPRHVLLYRIKKMGIQKPE